MFKSGKGIIVTSIKNVEEILREQGNNISPKLKEKFENIIYKGYEELEKELNEINFKTKGNAYEPKNKTNKK